MAEDSSSMLRKLGENGKFFGSQVNVDTIRRDTAAIQVNADAVRLDRAFIALLAKVM